MKTLLALIANWLQPRPRVTRAEIDDAITGDRPVEDQFADLQKALSDQIDADMKREARHG